MTSFNKRILIVVFSLLGIAVWAKGSREAPETTVEPAFSQGIEGRVEIWEGNFMPMTDPKSAQNSKTPGAGLRVRLHEPVKMSSANALLPEVPTPMVAETTTDADGKFILKAAPGSYSIFVEENDGWYYNGWDGQGVQGAVEVLPDQNTSIVIKVTTNATF
jgi:hypothetical protein